MGNQRDRAALALTVIMLLGANADAGATGPAVEIADFGFLPDDIAVRPGETLTWTNQGSHRHRVVGEGFDSSYLEPEALFSVAFDRIGIFQYRCQIHSTMQGTVQVTDAAPQTTTPPREAATTNVTSAAPSPKTFTATSSTTTTKRPRTTTTAPERPPTPGVSPSGPASISQDRTPAAAGGPAIVAGVRPHAPALDPPRVQALPALPSPDEGPLPVVAPPATTGSSDRPDPRNRPVEDGGASPGRVLVLVAGVLAVVGGLKRMVPSRI